MPNSQGLPNNPYPDESIQSLVLKTISLRSIIILSPHLRLGFPRAIFLGGLFVKIMKTHLPSSILTTYLLILTL